VCSNRRGEDDLRVFFSGAMAYIDGSGLSANTSQWPHLHVQPDKTVLAHIDLRNR